MKKAALVTVVVGLWVSLGAGCAPMTSGGQPPTAPKVERRLIARGVELHISEDAGFEAQRVADEFTREVRSREISAR